MPAGFLETVIEYRAYAHAKAMVDAADTAEARRSLPKSDMVDLVQVIDLELASERLTQRT